MVWEEGKEVYQFNLKSNNMETTAKSKGLNWTQAEFALGRGDKLKLPEWIGYWFMEGDSIKVMDRKGDVLDTPYVNDYTSRTDWEITDGLRDFGGALVALKAGKKVTRTGWNNPEISCELQVPDVNSKMTKPYIYMNKGLDKFPLDLSCESVLAEDWTIIE